MTQLIGVTGFKRSGKGTVSDILSQLGDVGDVHQVGFSDKVKVMAARSLGYTGSDEWLIALMDEAKLDPSEGGWEICPGLTGRQLLQNVGMAGRDVFGEDHWVDLVLPRPGVGSLSQMYPAADTVVLTDLRFENEARRVIDLGGAVWEVLRPGVGTDGHDSEKPLPNGLVNRRIDNDSDRYALIEKVREAVQESLW